MTAALVLAACKQVPEVPSVFSPGSCFRYVPQRPAPWWDLGHVTEARLGWWLFAVVVASWVITTAWERVSDRREAS